MCRALANARAPSAWIWFSAKFKYRSAVKCVASHKYLTPSAPILFPSRSKVVRSANTSACTKLRSRAASNLFFPGRITRDNPKAGGAAPMHATSHHPRGAMRSSSGHPFMCSRVYSNAIERVLSWCQNSSKRQMDFHPFSEGGSCNKDRNC
jgi:hypothetical protein